jgi:NAD(P)-dependent dehydrogenase (short-subunit alcohol dehydrogenase family)
MDRTAEMAGRVCLVTGASNGIGKETAAGLAARGARVAMVARDRSRGEAALAEVRQRSGSDSVELILADLASLDEVRGLARDFRAGHDRLHVLVNNAGAFNAQRSETRDGFETTIGVNHLAHFLLTAELLGLLKASAPSRIINVSSAAHVGARIDFDDLQSKRRYGGMRVYGQSKLANVLFTYELARRLEGSGVTANCLHPGVVTTGFGRNNDGLAGLAFEAFHLFARPFLLTPERGAETSIYLASSLEVEGVSGKYFVKKQAVPSSPASYDEATARRLWDVSEQLVKEPATAAT